jgi:putative transposase
VRLASNRKDFSHRGADGKSLFYCERVIGSIRRECLDWVIVLNEIHLKRILTSYFDYYHRSRTHLSLHRNSPMPREIEPPSRGKVIAVPQVGGLHHRYTRVA